MKYQVGDLFVHADDLMMYILEDISAAAGLKAGMHYRVHYYEINKMEYIYQYHVSSIDCMVQPNGGWKHYPVRKQI